MNTSWRPHGENDKRWPSKMWIKNNRLWLCFAWTNSLKHSQQNALKVVITICDIVKRSQTICERCCNSNSRSIHAQTSPTAKWHKQELCYNEFAGLSLCSMHDGDCRWRFTRLLSLLVCVPSPAPPLCFHRRQVFSIMYVALMNFILIFEAYTRWRDNDWWLIIFTNFYRFIGRCM